MAYTKQTWHDLPSKDTPINASRLGHIEDGIYDAAATADNAAAAIGNLKTAAYKDSTNAVTQASTDLVESGAVYASVHAVAQDLSDTNLAVAALQTASTNLGKYKAEADSIAPVELDATGASQAYAVDEQFYLNNILMTATSPISQNDAIVVYPTSGYNCKPSDSITEQISTKADKSSLGTASTKNSTSVVTQSTDLVESGAVYDVVGWGNKNHNKGDANHVFIKGTARTFYFPLSIPIVSGHKYKVVTDVSAISGYTGTKALNFKIVSASADISDASNIQTTVQGQQVVEMTATSSADVASIYCYIPSGESNDATITLSNVMFVEEGVTDYSYEPYHASVSDSLEEKADNSVIAPVENGATASQAYAVGEHFIRDGAFCTVTQAIAQGGTFTLNTNYTAGDVATNFETKAQNISVQTISGISFSTGLSQAYKNNKTVDFKLRFTADSEITFSTATVFATLPFIPIASALAFSGYNDTNKQFLQNAFVMGSTGNISFTGTIPAGTYYVTGTYICQ